MKYLFLRILVAVLTFFLGVSLATLRRPRPNQQTFVSSDRFADTKQSSTALAWQTLLSYEQRELKELNERERDELKAAVVLLTGKSENEFRNLFLAPRLFAKVSDSLGRKRYVLVEESPLVIIPGSSSLRISFFDVGGEHLGSSEFDAGWRIALKDMRFTQVKGLPGDVLKVESLPWINGRDTAKQYYAMVGDKMLVIRLEDGSGRLVRNIYRTPNHTIGMTRFGWSVEDWEKKLHSTDRSEVLAALTWLSGVHLNPDEGDPGYLHEDIHEAKVAADVIALESVRATLKELMQADHSWIRSAAKLSVDTER